MWSTTLNARGWYIFDEDMYTLRASLQQRFMITYFAKDANLRDTIFKVTNFERYVSNIVIFL